MSSITASVEWLFDDVIIYFEFMDFKKKKKLKIGVSLVRKMYLVWGILQDAYLSGEKKNLKIIKAKSYFNV